MKLSTADYVIVYGWFSNALNNENKRQIHILFTILYYETAVLLMNKTSDGIQPIIHF